MKNSGRVLLALVVFQLLGAGMNAISSAEERPHPGDDALSRIKPREQFEQIRSLYWKWEEGLYGSRNFHERGLRAYLNSLMNREIVTGANYIVVYDEAFSGLEVRAQIQDRWLTLRGRVDADSLAPLLKKKPDLLKAWWRSQFHVAVKGRVKDYSLVRREKGCEVILYLYKIVIVYDEPVK